MFVFRFLHRLIPVAVVLVPVGCAVTEPPRTGVDTLADGAVAISSPSPSLRVGAGRRVSGPTAPGAKRLNALSQTEYFVGARYADRGQSPPRVATVADDGDVTLDFVDVPLAEVVDVVIGDILEQNYSISPGVQGSVTTRTTSPLRRDALLATLENILALRGASLVKANDIWHVVPIGEAGRLPNVVVTPGRPSPSGGEAIHIIPLEHTAVDSVMGIVSGQVTPGRQLVADAQRNLMIFVGPPQEARAIEDLVAVLDVDMLSDKVFALVPLDSATVGEVIAELQVVFEDNPKTLRLVPIERLQAILVIAREATAIDEVRRWVDRLDRRDFGAERQAFVYHVLNNRAVEMAMILQEVFADEATAPGSTVAPGLEEIEIGTDEELASSGNPAGSSGQAPRIIADERNNALVIMATADQYASIEAVLHRLDIPPLQVLIEVVVAEVSLEGNLKHGVEWFVESGGLGLRWSSLGNGAVANSYPGFGFALDGLDAKVVLNALERVTDVKVVSSPKLMVLDNQSARLQVGDQVPVATRSSVSSDNPDAPIVNDVTLVDTGVILEVTPTVNADGLVSLTVLQEVSDATTTATSDIDSPTIETRKVESTLAVQSGETVALAGLIRDRRELTETGVPLLRTMPGLGNLFKTRDKKSDRTELLVLITPRVARDPAEMRSLTNELKRRITSSSL